MEAAEMQLEEISLGKLAQQKGNSAHIKELGKMMEEDHTKSFTELQALAQSKSISIPTTVTEDSMDAYNNLNEENGNDFGKAYNDMVVEHHEDAIELYEKAATDSEDPAIRAWATEKLPGLRTHLQLAKSAKEKSDNTKS
jgi:putative membrane protein